MSGVDRTRRAEDRRAARQIEQELRVRNDVVPAVTVVRRDLRVKAVAEIMLVREVVVDRALRHDRRIRQEVVGIEVGEDLLRKIRESVAVGVCVGRIDAVDACRAVAGQRLEATAGDVAVRE